MGFYRKKPVIIEAIQWTGTNVDEIKKFAGNNAVFTYAFNHGNQTGILTKKPDNIPSDMECYPILVIKTLEGDMHANSNDFIIKGVHGEFYPCKYDIFLKTYEKIMDE